MLYITFDSDTVLCMKTLRKASPQATFPAIEQQYKAVTQISLRL